MTDLDVYVISREAKKPIGMPPVVFVHGAFAGAWCWDEHFMPWFCDRGYDVHAVDLPGRRGRPDHERLQSFTISDYLDALLTAIDAMPAPPVVVGHSMGGFLGWRAAELRKLAGLVLMAPVPPTGLAAPAMQLMLTNPALFMNVAQIHAGGGGTVETLHDTLFSASVPRELVAAYMPKFQSESQLAVAGLYAGHMPNILALWGTPIEIFGAAEDRLIPPAHAHWTASLAGRSAHIYEDMGHGMMLEAGWENVAADIADRLEAKCRS
jgi:pimeloyl-ACP methyl ester carboxylesterase